MMRLTRAPFPPALGYRLGDLPVPATVRIRLRSIVDGTPFPGVSRWHVSVRPLAGGYSREVEGDGAREATVQANIGDTVQITPLAPTGPDWVIDPGEVLLTVDREDMVADFGYLFVGLPGEEPGQEAPPPPEGVPEDRPLSLPALLGIAGAGILGYFLLTQ